MHVCTARILVVVYACLLLPAVHGHRPHDVTTTMDASADGQTLFARVRRQILRSSDGGMTWTWRAFGVLTPITTAPTDRSEIRLFMSPTYINDSLVYVHNTDGIYKTTNGGDSWQLLPNSPFSITSHDNLVFSSSFATDNLFWVFGLLGSIADVYASSDGGSSYTRLNCPVVPVTMIGTTSGLLVCGDDGNLYTSTDYATWVLVATLGIRAQRMRETRAGPGTVRLLIGGNTGVLHISLCRNTLRAGCGTNVSYAAAVADVPNPHNLTYSVGAHTGPMGDESLYILPSTASFILRSVDNGLTWQRQGNMSGVRGSEFSDSETDYEAGKTFQCFKSVNGTERLYMGGYGGFHVSVDSGATWGHVSTFDLHWTSIAPTCLDATCSSWLLSACTYAADCYHVNVNRSKLETTGPATAASVVYREDVPTGGFGITALSPNYQNDFIEIRVFSARIARYDRPGGFNLTAARSVYINGFPSGQAAVINALQISPGFGFTNGEVYVSGVNLGAMAWKSVDYGMTYSRLGPPRNGTSRVILSDRFDQDRTMAASSALLNGLEYVYWSTNGGTNWVRIDGNQATGVWVDVCVFRGKDATFPVVIGAKASGGVRQIFITRGGIWAVLFPLSTYNTLRPGGFGEYGIVFLPVNASNPEPDTRTLYAAYYTGGARFAEISTLNASLIRAYEALPTPSAPNTGVGWSHANVDPTASAARPMQQKVKPSPQFHADGVVFAVSYDDIMMSSDRGVTWDIILSLPESLTEDCTSNCSFCSAANPRAKTCLVCNPGFRRIGAPSDPGDSEEEVWNFRCEASTITSTTAAVQPTTAPPPPPTTTTPPPRWGRFLRMRMRLSGVSTTVLVSNIHRLKQAISRRLPRISEDDIVIERVYEVESTERRLLHDGAHDVGVDFTINGLLSTDNTTSVGDVLVSSDTELTTSLQQSTPALAGVNVLLTEVLSDACDFNNCAPDADCTPTDGGSFTCTCRAGFIDVSPPVSFVCQSNAASNPHCQQSVWVDAWMHQPHMSVRVAETDFNAADEFVSAVLVNGESVPLVNDLRVGAVDCQCQSTTLVAMGVPLPTGGAQVSVDVFTTPAVTRMPCCCCGMSLRAEAIVHHSSGLACAVA